MQLFLRQLRKCLNEEIIKELSGNAEVLSELEREWEQLRVDRDHLRQIFPTGDSKVQYLSFTYYILSGLVDRNDIDWMTCLQVLSVTFLLLIGCASM